MTKAQQSNQWPAWSQDADGYRGLASYASRRAITGLGLVPDELHNSTGDPARVFHRKVLTELWDRLVAARYRYRFGMRIADGRQRIKDPLTVHHSAGNCLEVSLMFTAMCLQSGLRAYPVVLRDHRGGDSDHAVVLVDLTQPADDARPLVPEFCEELDGGEGTAEKHVYRRSVDAGDELPAGYVAIDVVPALVHGARLEQGTFADACEAGARALLDVRGYTTVRVVDVVALHADGQLELPKQDDEDRPAIYPSLPAQPAFRDYPSRAALVDELSRRRGLVVLCGESGVGKSTLAARLAQKADAGSGWFLNASSSTTLAAALAAAELAERGDVVPGPAEPADVSSNANAARTRLKGARGGWVVVLDNADIAPGALRGLPEVDGSRGQLLLVTTTHEAWRQRADHFVDLKPLAQEEVVETLGEDPGLAVTQALDGRPLMLEVSTRFRRTTGHPWWAEVDPGTADTAPARMWAAVDAKLRRHPAGETARAVARAVAWLPPVAVGTAVLESAVPSPGVEAAVTLLHDLGALELRSGAVQMHRLFREAILADRDSAAAEHRAVVEALLDSESMRAFLARVPDLDVLRQMQEIVGEDLFRLHALAALIERHDTKRAAKYYELVLAGIPGDGRDDAERRVVVDSLRGQCRWIVRDSQPKPADVRRRELDNGIEMATRALGLSAGLAPWEDRLAASRAEAMLGLLLRARSNNLGSLPIRIEPDADRARELLDRAGRHLRHSAAERKVLYKEAGVDLAQAADVDRSEFNLAGLGVRLAQLDRENSAKHLDQADEIYRRVGELRRIRYQSDDFDEVVTCRHGQALVAYYRAVLNPGTGAAKYGLLRTAADLAHSAAVHRGTAAGALDDTNTAKSVQLQLKIALARFALGDPSSTALPKDLDEFQREREDLVRTIATDPEGRA